ncbi:MAG: septal ring lytic transglycosylase RlpA family protein [Alphaproteobacteria bacterium]
MAPTASTDYKVGKPYQIRGQWYYPAENLEYSETGIASWYGQDFNGLRTANGERYDMSSLTAAHRTLPMPSAVRVTNLENGRSIVLRINDRGPFASGRIIDVSRRAANLLGFQRQGTAKVRVDILADESRNLKLAALNSPKGRSQQVAIAASPRQTVTKTPLAGVPESPAVLPASKAAASRPTITQTSLPTAVTIQPVQDTSIFVQVGAFGDFGNALRIRDQLYQLGPTSIRRIRSSGLNLYRVRLGPLRDVRDADALLAEIAGVGVANAQIVVD